MDELMLISNPTGNNPWNMVYVAPYSYKKSSGKRVSVPGYVKGLPGERNVMRRRRNPVSVGALRREWLQGIDLMDAGAALGGLAASTMLPGMIIKEEPVTMGQKVWKLALAVGSTAGAGFVFRNISTTAGKMAIAGGLAGALSQALAMFTGVQIGQQLGLPGPRRRIAESMVVSPSPNREQETVQMIIP